MGYLIGVVDQWVHEDPEVLLSFYCSWLSCRSWQEDLLVLWKINLAVKWLSITFSDHLLVIVQLLLEKFLLKQMVIGTETQN